jgi:hypothetical protein
MKKITLVYRDFENKIAKESIWAEECDGYYITKNSPFFAANLAWGDTIEAYEEDGMLYYSKLIARSGNSNIQIVAFKNMENKLKDIIDTLNKMGCGWESIHEGRYYAINIAPELDYSKIRIILQKGFNDAILDFREAYLSDIHRAQVS